MSTTAAARTASIDGSDKYICCARLSTHNAMYCRRRATTFVLYDDEADARLWRAPGAPVCDRHLREVLASQTAGATA